MTDRDRADHHSLALLGDVGGADYHVGDEAMLEANRQRLLAFDPTLEIRVLGRSATGEEIAAALSGAQAALVSGGGNMSATWPELLDQRLFLLREAARLGLPVAVGGQTLGPELSDVQHGRLREHLSVPVLVGVRELPSYALALALGVAPERLVLQVDDAHLLIPERPAESELVAKASEPFLAVSLDPSFGAREASIELRALAMQIGDFATEHGLSILFVPHEGNVGRRDAGDGIVGTALVRQLTAGGAQAAVAPLLPATETAWLTRQAAAVVSSRYHGLVFATAGAVPAVGIHRDRYTRIKLQGALEHVGAARWTVASDAVPLGHLGSLLGELWHERRRLTESARTAHELIVAGEHDRFERLVAALGLGGGAEARRTRQPLGGPPGALARRALAALDLERRREREGLGRTLAGISSAPMGMLSEERWDRFARDGFMHLGPVLDPERVRELQQRADDLATGRVRNDAVALQIDTGGAYEDLPPAVTQAEVDTIRYRKIQGLEHDELFLPLIRHPLFLEICAHQYAPHAAVSIFRAMVMNKPAGQGTHLPWHQDGGDVWALDRDPLVTVWIALDPATTENGCMEAVPGSHRLGLLSAAGSNLSPEAAERHCPPAAVVPLEVPAGHAVLLHNWLIHRSGINPSAIPRRAVTICYLDGRTRSVLTGDRFPLVHGALGGGPDPYVAQLIHERDTFRANFGEAERYARSLEAEVQKLRGLLGADPVTGAVSQPPR